MDKPLYNDSGIEIKKVYTADSDSYNAITELPGQYPFTRGVQPDMYRGKPWTMRQYAGFSTAEESNKRYHYLLSHGVTGLSVAFDLPTQIGYDSDHQLAEGEVGKVGVAIDSLEDMQTLFNGINLEQVSTSMTINATGFILLALYVAVARQQGADLTKLTGTIQTTFLKNMLRGAHTSILRNLLCGSSPTYSNGAAKSCLNGTRYQFRDIISGKQAARRCRK
jgi:methylmalonyl-CoA mutase, N-terminal domain